MDNLFIVPPEQTAIDQWLPIISALAVALWSAFKSSESFRSWRNRVGDEQFDAAMRAVEAGVQLTYENYVRRTKLEAPEHKLTDEQRSRARLDAIQHAVSVAPSGVDVIKTLGGHAQAQAVVDDIVRKSKAK